MKMTEGSDGPTAARNKVKYALLKDTFWDLLQDPGYRRKAMDSLSKKWLSKKSEVKFWWVNQGQTYQKSREAGFIWAPKRDKGGNTPFHWKNMESVKPGDIVFNYAEGAIRSVSIATSAPFEAEIGVGTGTGAGEGWRVDLDYYDITPPCPLSAIGSRIASLGNSHAPIDSNGSVNQGYLYKLSEEAVAIIVSQLDLGQL